MPTSAIKDLLKKWEPVTAMVLEWHPNQADVSRKRILNSNHTNSGPTGLRCKRRGSSKTSFLNAWKFLSVSASQRYGQNRDCNNCAPLSAWDLEDRRTPCPKYESTGEACCSVEHGNHMSKEVAGVNITSAEVARVN
ncbi:hypothetical protein TNCV_4683351 [Trichonephila clavipes]|nr:hypothetical protein TNCV_4683351 [Trichonephila clavipes]